MAFQVLPPKPPTTKGTSGAIKKKDDKAGKTAEELLKKLQARVDALEKAAARNKAGKAGPRGTPRQD